MLGMRALVLMAIRGYQRYLSPHKGFCCAYRAHTGRCSCSALGYRAVRRYGTLNGIAVLRRRMYLCGVAHRRYAPSQPLGTYRPARPPRAQRGDCACDLPCDFGGGGSGGGCDLPDIFRPDTCNTCNGCNGCDWPSRDDRYKKKDRKEERHVYVPPRRAAPRRASGSGHQAGGPS